MPIDFRCNQCNRLLRTADDTVGKKAKCPECGNIVTIPATSAPSGTEPAVGAAPAVGPTEEVGPIDSSSPFAEPRPHTPEGVNPYQSPAASAMAHGTTPWAGVAGDMRPTRLDFGELLNRTWSVFSAQLGTCVLFGLVIIGIQIAAQLVGAPLGIAQEFLQVPPAIAVALFVAQQAWGIVVQALQMCISMIFALNLIRGHVSPMSGMFNIGSVFLPVLGFQAILVLVIVGICAVCAIPFGVAAAVAAVSQDPNIMVIGAIISALLAIPAVVYAIVLVFRWFLTNLLIIDRNMGVFEAMSTSSRFMLGNKLTVLGTFLVAGLLGVLFVVATCCIGALFYAPYIAILTAITYLSATGQWTG